MKPSIHWLFVFIPITLILDPAGNVPPPAIFFSAALAIVPVASLIVRSTEQLARGPATPWAVCSTPPSAMRPS
jgi:Ca2+:H+ antiporter